MIKNNVFYDTDEFAEITFADVLIQSYFSEMLDFLEMIQFDENKNELCR